jgi:hypothetical protein
MSEVPTASNALWVESAHLSALPLEGEGDEEPKGRGSHSNVLENERGDRPPKSRGRKCGGV